MKKLPYMAAVILLLGWALGQSPRTSWADCEALRKVVTAVYGGSYRVERALDPNGHRGQELFVTASQLEAQGYRIAGAHIPQLNAVWVWVWSPFIEEAQAMAAIVHGRDDDQAVGCVYIWERGKRGHS